MPAMIFNSHHTGASSASSAPPSELLAAIAIIIFTLLFIVSAVFFLRSARRFVFPKWRREWRGEHGWYLYRGNSLISVANSEEHEQRIIAEWEAFHKRNNTTYKMKERP